VFGVFFCIALMRSSCANTEASFAEYHLFYRSLLQKETYDSKEPKEVLCHDCTLNAHRPLISVNERWGAGVETHFQEI